MITKKQYIEYLLSTPINYTGANLAAHLDGVSHDQVTDFLNTHEFTGLHLWQLVKGRIQDDANAFLIVDDSVQEKPFARKMENVYYQYSGNKHAVVHGIGIVNLVHTTKKHDVYPIDYRIYDPDHDGKTKNDHFIAMLQDAFTDKNIKARYILFDSWYGSVANLKFIHRQQRIFFTTLKENRLVSIEKGRGRVHLQDITWTAQQLRHGQYVKLKDVPFLVRLFKIVAQDGSIAWVITNLEDPSFCDEQVRAIQQQRWDIEPFHREFKQLTGSERCQCRKARAQRTHLACCYHAWLTLKEKARAVRTTPYQVRLSLFEAYLRDMLREPRIPALA